MSYLTCLDQLGIDYTVRGDEASARCPAHEDRHPSWSCNILTGKHHCFTCGFGGDFPRIVQQVMKYGPDRAAVWCRERDAYGVPAVEHQDPPADASWKYSEAAMMMYGPPPEHKLRERKLTPEAAAEYEILWDDAKLSWIFPIRDPYTGELWGWQEKNDELGIFRNRPRSVAKSRTLFGFRAFEHGSRAIIVESPLDAARLRAAGVRGGLATYGVQISDKQLSLVRNSAGAVVFAFDNDIAGLRVCHGLRTRVHHIHRFLNYTVAPQAKDPGDMSDEECVAAVERATADCLTRFDLKRGVTVVYS